jgi:nitrate reductase NapAB chaperone NapD
MQVAGMIVTAAPELADEVARRLGRVRGVSVYGVHGGTNVVIVAEAYDDEQIENLSWYIRGSFEGVRSVSTTIVRSDSDASSPARAGSASPRLPLESGKEEG